MQIQMRAKLIKSDKPPSTPCKLRLDPNDNKGGLLLTHEKLNLID